MESLLTSSLSITTCKLSDTVCKLLILTPVIRVIKNAVRGSGANLTKSRLFLVSKVAKELLEGGRKLEQILRIDRKSSHTIRSAREDVEKMVNTLVNNGVIVDKERRLIEGWKFVDPRREGILKLEKGWLRDFLAKGGSCDAVEPIRRQIIDLEDVDLF